MAVKSAQRVLLIIDLLTENEDGLTFTELQQHLDVPRSSLHGLLSTLLAGRYLTQDPETRRYRIGLRLWEAGQSFVRAARLDTACIPVMKIARDTLNLTIQLAALDGIYNVYLEKVPSKQPVALVTEIGARLPAYATGLGKALLAHLPEDELHALLDDVTLKRFTSTTITDREELLKELRLTRERGYSRDVGEHTSGIFCIGVPIWDHRGRVVASASTSRLDFQAETVSEQQMIDVMRHAGAVMSRRLGYLGPVHEPAARDPLAALLPNVG